MADLPGTYQDIAQQPGAGWTFISQIEHPHLNTPWYMLHPCQTAELLQLVLLTDESEAGTPTVDNCLEFDNGLRYMTAWFSLVGPVIHMHGTCDWRQHGSKAAHVNEAPV